MEILIDKLCRLSEGIVQDYYKITFDFPKYEMYALGDQIRRAMVSIPSNLYEGRCQNTDKSKNRFYSIAHGSLTEVKYQMKLARQLSYIKESDYNNFGSRAQEISKLLISLIKAIEKG